MAFVGDIRVVKKQLREKYRSIRKKLDPQTKEKWDLAIYEKVINLKEYKDCKTVFCFVSTDIEVDTRLLIAKAFEDKKIVAVPKCLDRNGNMEFYQIKSFDDLELAYFNLLEPKLDVCPTVKDYKNSICILPGFAFDKEGFRIGFGKGFYDRFLQKFKGVKIGICYNACIANALPHGRYDQAADYIVTQKYVLTAKACER